MYVIHTYTIVKCHWMSNTAVVLFNGRAFRPEGLCQLRTSCKGLTKTFGSKRPAIKYYQSKVVYCLSGNISPSISAQLRDSTAASCAHTLHKCMLDTDEVDTFKCDWLVIILTSLTCCGRQQALWLSCQPCSIGSVHA